MKNLDLSNYGVVEMNATEIVETKGGSILLALFVGFVIGLMYGDFTSDGQMDGDYIVGN